jgi:hypothetical protein
MRKPSPVQAVTALDALSFLILIHRIATRPAKPGFVYPEITPDERRDYLAFRAVGYPFGKMDEIFSRLRIACTTFDVFVREYRAVSAMFKIDSGAGADPKGSLPNGGVEHPALERGSGKSTKSKAKEK